MTIRPIVDHHAAFSCIAQDDAVDDRLKNFIKELFDSEESYYRSNEQEIPKCFFSLKDQVFKNLNDVHSSSDEFQRLVKEIPVLVKMALERVREENRPQKCFKQLEPQASAQMDMFEMFEAIGGELSVPVCGAETGGVSLSLEEKTNESIDQVKTLESYDVDAPKKIFSDFQKQYYPLLREEELDVDRLKVVVGEFISKTERYYRSKEDEEVLERFFYFKNSVLKTLDIIENSRLLSYKIRELMIRIGERFETLWSQDYREMTMEPLSYEERVRLKERVSFFLAVSARAKAYALENVEEKLPQNFEREASALSMPEGQDLKCCFKRRTELKDLELFSKIEVLRYVAYRLPKVENDDKRRYLMDEYNLNVRYRHNVRHRYRHLGENLEALQVRSQAYSFKSCCFFSRSQTESEVKKNRDLFKGSSDGEIERFLQSLSLIPVEERPSVFLNAKLLIKGDMSDNEIALILEEISFLPIKEREQICRCVSLCAKRSSYFKNNPEYIFSIISHFPQEEREQVCLDALPLIKDFMSPFSISSILQAVYSLPKKGRASICQDAQFLIMGEIYASAVRDILRGVVLLPERERGLICQEVSSLVRTYFSRECPIDDDVIPKALALFLSQKE